jgi:hypothetical protein
MLSAWFFFVWFLLRGADSVRPSALQRMNTLIWIYIAAWVLLVAVTVMENNFGLAGGYFLVFYFAVVFLALLISYLELLNLPTKTKYARIVASDYDTSSVAGQAPSTSASHGAPSSSGQHDEDDDADETESLLRNDRTRTLGRGYDTMHRHRTESIDYDTRAHRFLPRPYEHEQAWSGGLPKWTWLLQFLLLGPIPIILCTQVALLQTSALNQTPADGSPVLIIYIFIVLLTVLLLAPVTPFIHRLNVLLPTILFLVFAGTLTYNLLAFPFSDNARLKVYFLQSVNLDTGINTVSLSGLPSYTDRIIASIPSSVGQNVNCSAPEYKARSGLHKCTWSGPPPNVLLDPPSKKHSPKTYAKWMKLTTTRLNTTKSSAKFTLSGANTRACRLVFDSPISTLSVQGYTTDSRFPSVGRKGCTSIRLWSREWGGSWNVTVEWEGSGGLSGRAVCLWSDANDPAAIPAYTEVLRFMPRWSQVTKLSDGLVEGWKEFKI